MVEESSTYHDFERLKAIEERRPDKILASTRTDYPWAFDPDTGRLLPYRDAYVRAVSSNCPAACVSGGYAAMLEQTMKGSS